MDRIARHNFNTSHVSINLYELVHEPVHDRHFNTSHVSINQSAFDRAN